MGRNGERCCNGRRNDRRLRPVVGDAGEGGAPLEQRLLLSGGLRLGRDAESAAVTARPPEAHSRQNHVEHPPKRLTPIQKINMQYAVFMANFQKVLQDYVDALQQESTTTVFVTTTLTADYVPPASVMQVANATVFGPSGMYAKPVTATASLSGVTIGKVSLIGSSANMAILSAPAAFSLNAGATLSANVPASAATSAASIFPTYITNSTIQLAINLIQYFNSLPVELPKANAPPHTPVQRSAIQTFTYESIAGASATSLLSLLLAIPLPSTPFSDLDIYEASVQSAVEQSQIKLISSIQQIYAGTLLIPAPSPANRLGESFNTSSTSSGSSTASGSTSSGGTS